MTSDDIELDPSDLGDDRPGLEDADPDNDGTDDGDDLDPSDLGDDRPGLEDADPDDDDTDDDDDLDFGDVEDATEDDVDFIVALHREDGTPVVTALEPDLANDLDALIAQLRRLPGDSGASALVSVDGDFFAAVRVRGRHVQVVLSDVYAADTWSLASDIVDYLGIDVPEDDDEDGLVGDLDIFTDQGLSAMNLEAICSDWDATSDELALQVADAIHFGPQVRKIADA